MRQQHDSRRRRIEEKKPHILMEEKDYITEAWVQGGKAIGSAIKPKKKKK